MVPGKTSFTMSSLYLYDLGKDVQIVEVKARTSPNVEYLGAFTVWPRDFPTNKYLGGPDFPPARLKVRHPIDETVPAAETTVLPEGYRKPPPLTVALGFRIASGDVGAVNGVRVIYKLGGKIKHHDFREAVIGCVQPNPCQSQEGTDHSEFEDQALRRFDLVPKD
jgi:hypothetical protein